MMDFMAELPEFLRMVFALAVVVALMGGLAMVMRRLGLSGAQTQSASGKRLKVLEKLPLDARRQMVLVQRDDVTHLIIMSATGETVVETGIKTDEVS